MMVRRLRLAVTPMLAAALFTAGPPALASTVRVEIKALAFVPANVEAQPGDTIEWVNEDFVAHTATERDHRWDVMLPPHGSGRTVLGGAGTIEYFCRFHPNMKGTIVVKLR